LIGIHETLEHAGTRGLGRAVGAVEDERGVRAVRVKSHEERSGKQGPIVAADVGEAPEIVERAAGHGRGEGEHPPGPHEFHGRVVDDLPARAGDLHRAVVDGPEIHNDPAGVRATRRNTSAPAPSIRARASRSASASDNACALGGRFCD